MANPEIKMIASIGNHMPLLTVWKESGVTDPYGFDLVVHLADRVLPGQPEIGMRGRSERLLDGTYQFVSGLHFEPYYTRAKGDKRLTYLAQAQNDWDDRLIATEEIQNVHDLEGKSLVVTAPARLRVRQPAPLSRARRGRPQPHQVPHAKGRRHQGSWPG